MTGYDPAVRTAEGNRKRLRASAVLDVATLRRMADSTALLACTDNRHHTETDPDTGDEVCRHCGVVVE